MKRMITEQLELTLGSNMKECTNEELLDTIYIDFLDEGAQDIYQEVSYNDRENLKNLCDAKLDHYNEKYKSKSMDIVLFQDAI